MDGPNVNLKFLRELKSDLRNASDPHDLELFDIGTCSLHVVHGGYKTAHNACGWEVHVFLRSLYYLFKDFPSRRSDYTDASNSSVLPLRFCSVRLVENSAVIKRAVEMLPFLKLYVDAVERKPPDSQTFKKMKIALNDKMLPAKLGLLQSVALELEPFLTKYQSNEPLLPFMHIDLYSLLRDLLCRFIKTEIMATVTNATKLMAVDFKKKDSHMTLHNIDIGFAANSACKSLPGVEVLKFKDECSTYLQHLCMKLTAKCPLNYRLLTGATCLNPRVMQNESLRNSRVTTALEVFVDKKRMTPDVADIVKREYTELCESPVCANAGSLQVRYGQT
jgi:TusA-related sulfurtransferase